MKMQPHLEIADIVECLPDGYIAVDRQFHIGYWNKEAERLTGQRRELMLGTALWDAFPGLSGTVASTKLYNAINEQMSVQLEHDDIRLNKWWSIRAYPASGGLSIFFEDVTERKQLERLIAHLTFPADGKYRFYNPALSVSPELSMERDLRRAIERNELVLYYQPQVNICEGGVSGVEALLRWNHPEWGMVPPDRFIPLAEQTDLIIAIGDWVLRTACAQHKKWMEAGFPHMTMSVNLSAKQFMDSNLVGKLRAVLEETGLPAKNLVLEITESMAMEVDRTIAILEQLKQLGVHISIDDFGKGFSSLYYLKRFPLDAIKIDRTFVMDCMQDENDASIVKAIIEIARNLKLKVIAEGVETNEQLSFLQGNLCDEAQGYLFSKPVPGEKFEQTMGHIMQMPGYSGIDPERKKRLWLEEQLRIAREDLQTTVRKQQGMTFKFKEKDGQFIFTLCDGMLTHRIGLSPQLVVGKTLFDFLPHGLAEEITDYYKLAWLGDKNVTFEGCLNGISFMTSLSPVRRRGHVVEVIGTCSDISELKRVEGELRAAKEQLESFIENTSDAIHMIDLQGNVLRVNAAFENMFGWQTSEIAGRFLPNVPERLIDETRHLWQCVLNGERISSYESQRIRKDGTQLDTSITLSAIKDPQTGRPTAIVGIVRDISCRKRSEMERQQAEEMLRSSEAKYRLIAENMTDLIGFLDGNGKVIYASPSHAIKLGYPLGQFAGISTFDLIHPEDIPHVAEGFQIMLRERKPIQLEFRMKHRSGSWISVEANGSPVVAKEGDPVHFVVVGRDITERKQAEEMLIHSGQLAIVEQLAAAIEHDIRSPISTLKGFYSLLRMGMIKEQYFPVIDGEFLRLETIITDFLSFAKPPALACKRTAVKEMIDEVVCLLESQTLLRNIQIVTSVEPESLSILCDAPKLKQVFVNVLNHAMNAMPFGGDIYIEARSDGDSGVKLRFIDSGSGDGEARGLGLMICRKWIRQHQGSIAMESDSNRGTTVTVLLPEARDSISNHLTI